MKTTEEARKLATEIANTPTGDPSPAPWHVEPHEYDEGRSLGIFDAEGGEVCRILPPESCPEELKWDEVEREPFDIPSAHLIAAAPELLEACKALFSLVEPKSAIYKDPNVSEWCNIARAAIAKATKGAKK